MNRSLDLLKNIKDYACELKSFVGRGFSYRGTNDKIQEKIAVKVIDIRAIQGKPKKDAGR
jgi:hypothetical protein